MSEDLQALLKRLARERGPDAVLEGGAAVQRRDGVPAPPAPTGPADTQARIVEAALELFAERSYDAATTQAIASRAGVTEKTLFRHFGTKEELFKRTVYPAVFRLLAPIAIDELRATFEDPALGFREAIGAIVADRVRFGARHPAVVKMVAQELLLRPAFREAFTAFFLAQMWPPVRAFFDRARERGELRDVPSPVALRTMVTIVIGYLLQRTLFQPDGDWDEARDAAILTGLVLDGLAAR